MSAREVVRPLVCLMPTFRKPLAVRDSVQMFLRQNVRVNTHLCIYDDDGWFEPAWWTDGEQTVWLEVSKVREPSLGRKYNRMVEIMLGKLGQHCDLVVWEDDDIYAPDHVGYYRSALRVRPWCQPLHVHSYIGGETRTEETGQRFHAALGIRSETWREIGGWPEDSGPDFDQRLIAALRRKFGEPARLPKPTYTFNWSGSRYPHGEAFMWMANWYDRIAELWPKPTGGPRTVDELVRG